MQTEIDHQFSLIQRGSERIIEENDLKEKIRKSLESNKPLIVKLGADPTAPDLHLGHIVILKKLRHFQQLNHQAVFLIGDFTGRIGDPTGRDQTRPPLTEEQVLINAKSYQQQIEKILDPLKLKIVFNSHWLKNLAFEDIIKLTAWTTMAKLLEHNTFRTRFEQNESIRFNEMLYPFMQAYDSVALNADIELGGTDQTFNLTFGRDIQKVFGQDPQVCITMPILPGTDGKNKMSKSLGNYIGIDEPPYLMYEKIMRMADDNIVPYFILLTDKPLNEISAIENKLKTQSETGFILEQKKDLAFNIVEFFHNKIAAEKAQESYGKESKEGIRIIKIPNAEISSDKTLSIIRLLQISGKASSRSEARRLIEQGGVSINNVKIKSIENYIKIENEIILKVGKSFICKIIL